VTTSPASAPPSHRAAQTSPEIRTWPSGRQVETTVAIVPINVCGPTVLRLPKTEAFLTGSAFDEDTMHRAGEIVVSEITPISDVRGSADYRRQLARNVLLKFYHEHAGFALISHGGP